MNASVAQFGDRTVIGVGEAAGAIRTALRDWPAAVRETWASLALYGLAAAVAARYGAAPLTTLLHLLTACLAYGALYRRGFGRPVGPSGLQFGCPELRVLGASLLVGLVLAFAAILAFLAIGIVVLGVVMAVAPPSFNAGAETDWRAALSGPAGFAVAPAPLLALAGLVWLALRLSLAPAASVAEDRLRALSVFPLTRGSALGLLIVAVALGAPMLAAGVVAALVGRLPGAPHWIASAALGATFAFFAAPVWTGALVHIYQRLRPEAAAAGAP